jgi:predicted RNA-binding Zn ribbon-like protein
VTKFRSGNGAPWLDLLATLGGRYRARQNDALATPALLREWLSQHDLEPIGAVHEDDLAAARELREALHRMAVAALRDEPPAPADRRRVAGALAADRPLRLNPRAPGLSVARPATAAEALARLARDAVQDLTGARRDQLHACGDDTCSGIFLDTTGRRRWCSDQTCGNRLRVRAHRARVHENSPSHPLRG